MSSGAADAQDPGDERMTQENGIGRREFLGYGGKAALTASALGVLGTSGEAKAQVDPVPRPTPRAPDFIIDSHCHFGATEAWVEETVRIYRAHRAMACANAWIAEMELLKEAIQTYPDVFIGYGRVSVDEPQAVREVETFHRNGFLGIKFHFPQKNWDDPTYFQVYRLCEHLGMHMLFHTGVASRRRFDGQPQWGTPARMRPVYLDSICRQFPNTTVQGAHLGNPWYDEAAEAARWNPNLYFDVSGSTLHKLILLGKLDQLNQILWWATWEGADNPHTLQDGPSAWEHIVFGSDEGPAGLPGNIERFQQMLDANRVPEKDRAKMWALTMAQILAIDPHTRRRSG
jgi:uncharacterized protein